MSCQHDQSRAHRSAEIVFVGIYLARFPLFRLGTRLPVFQHIENQDRASSTDYARQAFTSARLVDIQHKPTGMSIVFRISKNPIALPDLF